MTDTRIQPDPRVVQRQNDLFDLWHEFDDEHADEPGYDPDDDPAFHAEARRIMGIADTSRSTIPDADVVRAGPDPRDGHAFEAYWTREEGLPRWATNPHPWTTLRDLLRKHPEIHDPEGLAAHYYHLVFKKWPGGHKGGNKAGPGR